MSIDDIYHLTIITNINNFSNTAMAQEMGYYDDDDEYGIIIQILTMIANDATDR